MQAPALTWSRPKATRPERVLSSKTTVSSPAGRTRPFKAARLPSVRHQCRAACDDATSLFTSADDTTTLLTSDNTQYLDRIHPEVAMWREAVYREREAVDKERETVKAILRREQEARDKERTAKWEAIKRELKVVHDLRDETHRREAAEQREVRLKRMLKEANTQLLARTGRLSMRGILEAAQESAETKFPEEVAALQPNSKNCNKQKSYEAAWAVLLSHDSLLRDKLTESTGWSAEELPGRMDQLRARLCNPLYTKSLKLIQESKDSVQLLQLKDVTDEKDVAALQCLCENLWFVAFYEMSVETYDRFVKAISRSSG